MDLDLNQLSRQLAGSIVAQLQTTPLPEYLTPTQAATLTGYTLRALEAMRARRRGPAFIKVGDSKNSSIRYRLEDIRTWMQSHREVTDAVR